MGEKQSSELNQQDIKFIKSLVDGMVGMLSMPDEILKGFNGKVPLKIKLTVWWYKIKARASIEHFRIKSLWIVVTQIGFIEWLKFIFEPVTQKLKKFPEHRYFLQFCAISMFSVFLLILFSIFMLVGR